VSVHFDDDVFPRSPIAGVKVFLKTFGCRANHADSEAVRALALAAGCEMVDGAETADVAVFNSCAVTTDAEADLRQAVRRAARAAPGLRSIVMGCVAGLADRRDALLALPSVTDVVAGADLPQIALVLGIGGSERSRSVPADIAQQSTRGLLRIQDGCDEHCTFCATTLARGANRSAPVERLVRDALALAQYHPEIVLTGVHIGTYGADIGTSLGALLQRLARDVPTVRFRLSSIEATEVTALVAELLTGDARRVAPSLHAPLQSGSDRVLRRMGRHWYTADAYALAIEHLVARCPVFGLGADVIAGFPGETDADHRATLALCERLPYTYLHVFPFSARPGTPATRLPGRLPPHVVGERAAELRALGARKRAAYESARGGGSADVIVVGASGRRTGVTEDYLTVNLADPGKPRGMRFQATLCPDGDLLVAH
jgi:threonylcarbamoyladenosine tRNA methylthiotransferase MtaB